MNNFDPQTQLLAVLRDWSTENRLGSRAADHRGRRQSGGVRCVHPQSIRALFRQQCSSLLAEFGSDSPSLPRLLPPRSIPGYAYCDDRLGDGHTGSSSQPGINLVALFGFTTLTGVIISPVLYIIGRSNPALIFQAGVLTVASLADRLHMCFFRIAILVFSGAW